MTYSRTLTPICGLLATALLALAQAPAPRAAAAPAPPDAWDQTPAPAPQAMPAPHPMPAPAPVAPLPPLPPVDIDLGALDLGPLDLNLSDLDAQISMAKEMARDMATNPDIQEQIENAKAQAGRMKLDMQWRAEDMREMAKNMAKGFAFAPQGVAPTPPTPPTPPFPPKATTFRGRGMSDDRLYSAGQSALDNRQWDEAQDYFSQVIARNGSRVDGALYWKAYALARLGRRDEAAAAIAELRKSYASSRWLDDAKVLELELKQASGQSVSPEAESDEQLKLMAINGLMQGDAERAVPLLEGLLKGSASPKVKRNALFVLAQSNSPKAQALVQQIARGGANPDLQVKAVTYMSERRNANNGQVLAEIYASSNDAAVKRAILQAYAGARDKDRLLQAARTEKNPELREFAIGCLAGNNGNPELWQLYQGETTTDGKLQLLRFMHSNGNAEKLLEVVRNEKDPKVRVEAMRALASQRTGVGADQLVSTYGSEQDQQIKESIVNGLFAQRNAKALVDIVRAEKDTKMKLRIVERLSNLKTREANDYLEELLKK